MIQGLEGIEPEAQIIITERRAIIDTFLEEALSDEPVEHPDTNRTYAQIRVHADRLQYLSMENDTEETNGRYSNLRSSLHRIASALGLYTLAEELTWQDCWRARLLDRPRTLAHRIDKTVSGALKPLQPETRYLVRSVRQLLAEIDLNHTDSTKRAENEQRFIRELVRRQFCRNKGNAHAVLAIIRGSKAKDCRNAIRKAARLRLFARLPILPVQTQVKGSAQPLKRSKRLFVPQHPKWEKLREQLCDIRAANPLCLSDATWLVQARLSSNHDTGDKVVGKCSHFS